MGPGRHDLGDQRGRRGPVFSAQAMIRDGVQAAWRRCDSGMCAGSVVLPRRKLRRWEATRLPVKNTSTVVAVIRASTFLPTSW